jgi:hypothetical protein
MRAFEGGVLSALQSLRPGAQYELRNNNYNLLTWNDKEQPKPSLAELEAELIRLEEEWIAQDYARNRKEEYPPMADQLDYMYHNGFEKWKTDMIDPIKDKYPKG